MFWGVLLINFTLVCTQLSASLSQYNWICYHNNTVMALYWQHWTLWAWWPGSLSLFPWMFPQWAKWTCFLKRKHASCLRLRTVKALKGGAESLPCKSRGSTRCRALQVLIRGDDSKDRLIRLELPFLPTWNSSAVRFMSGPAAAPTLFVCWKIGISHDKSLASFPSCFYGQTCVYLK